MLLVFEGQRVVKSLPTSPSCKGPAQEQRRSMPEQNETKVAKQRYFEIKGHACMSKIRPRYQKASFQSLVLSFIINKKRM